MAVGRWGGWVGGVVGRERARRVVAAQIMFDRLGVGEFEGRAYFGRTDARRKGCKGIVSGEKSGAGCNKVLRVIVSRAKRASEQGGKTRRA